MKDYQLYMDLIYLMVDGEASEIERQTLFTALNDNPELQSEFQNAIDINNAGKSFASSSEVPVPLTNDLFNKAGLTYTGTSHLSTLTAKTKLAAGIASGAGYLSRFGKLLIGKYGFGLMGLIIGGFVGFNFLGSNGEESQRNSDNMISKNEPVIIQLETVKDEDSNEKERKNVPVIKAYSDERSVTSYAGSINSELKSSKTMTVPTETSDENKTDQLLSFIDNPEINSTVNIRLARSLHLSDQKPVSYENSLDLLKDHEYDPNFRIEVNSSLFWNLPKETVSPNELAKLHNMNLFLYYKIKSDLFIGFGARQETFYVKYYTSDDLTRDYIYEQQPNLTNYEVSFRYCPIKTATFDPFVQLNLGGGEFGYTYRLGAGSRLRIYDDLAFTIYLEYASLMYKHRSDWQTARKLGVNYGINYTF